MSRGKYLYTIRGSAGELVAQGHASECARAMGMSTAGFCALALRIIGGKIPAYTGSRVWDGPGEPCGRKPLDPDEREERVKAEKARRQARDRERQAKRAQARKQTPTVDGSCRGCIYRDGGDTMQASCGYQRITGRSRLYSGMDPALCRSGPALDHPDACHPGAGCRMKKTEGRRGRG